jgi:serine/threonine protein kinase/tetratricopeptide (TPR) repeat protein
MNEKPIDEAPGTTASPEQRPAKGSVPGEATVDDPPRAEATGPFRPDPAAAPARGTAPGPGAEAPDLSFLQPSARAGALGRLNPYEVLEVLGQGSFGTVLKAFDPALQRLVAIKVLGAEAACDDTTRRRFLREARAAAAVRDEHVVGVFEVAEEPVPCLVMEYVSGGSLQDWIDRTGRRGVEDIVRIGAEVAQGLAAAHQQGLVHRDVKPANILLGRDEGRGMRDEERQETPATPASSFSSVKIADFGLAKAADDVRLTQSGVLIGTPLYMSPEQARGEPLDRRSDLFSLGSVLHALCTGQAPFTAASKLGVLKRVCQDTPRPIRAVNPDIPDWLSAVVGKLLAKDPARRFQTAGELADLLRRHLAHLRDPSLPAPPTLDLDPETAELGRPAGKGPGERTVPRRRPAVRWRRWAILGGAAALVLSGLAALPLLLRQHPPEQGTNAQPRPIELPDRPEQAEALARQLLAEAEVRWTPVTVADLRSAGGATFVRRADQSVVAIGPNAEGDVYTLALTDLPPTVSALRLEALPDPRLPDKGPGRDGGGIFLLGEVVLYHAAGGADAPVTAVPIDRGVADAADVAAPIEQAFDADPATGWRPGGGPGRPHWAIFRLREPLRCARGDRLLVRLEHAVRRGPANLGSFRLTVSEDPAAPEAQALHAAVRSAALPGFAALGAAHFCRAEFAPAIAALTRATETGAGPTELLLLALAHQEVQQPELARPLHERAMALLPRQPLGDLLLLLLSRALVRIEGQSPAAAEARRAELVEARRLAELTAAVGRAANKRDAQLVRGTWYAQHGRWRECAADFRAALERDPSDREAWEIVAAALILAGDPGPISPLFARLMREAFSSKDDMPSWTCHIRCQVGHLWPEGVALDRLPLAELDRWLANLGRDTWLLGRMQADRARVAYRRGNYEETVEWCRKALASEEKHEDNRTYREQVGSQVYAVRAMAEHRLRRPDEARQSFARAAGLMPAELQGLGTDDTPGRPPVDDQVLAGNFLADWVIAEVYRPRPSSCWSPTCRRS